VLHTVLIIVQVLLSASLIGLVLLQQGKGADMGAAFGSGASGTVFGSRGSANFLSRTTAILAALFFVNSMSLAYLVGSKPVDEGSIVDRAPPAATTPAVPQPAAPAPAVPEAPDAGQ
jgi:preprotein translocase subunit SecG